MVKLDYLSKIDPWQWPEDAGDLIAETLEDDSLEIEERLLAAELAGEYAVCTDEMMMLLVDMAMDDDLPAELRAKCAVGTGVGLQSAEESDICEGEVILDLDEEDLCRETAMAMRTAMKTLIDTPKSPKILKRRAFEASIRFPEEWHDDYLAKFYAMDDEDWKLTAVFAMQFVSGFQTEIVNALDSTNPMIFSHAVAAAATWEVKEGWPRLAHVLLEPDTPKDLLIAAIEISMYVYPVQAEGIVAELAESDDSEISEAAQEAMEAAEDGDEFDLDW